MHVVLVTSPWRRACKAFKKKKLLNKKEKLKSMNKLPSLDKLQSFRWTLVKIKSCVSILPNIEHCDSGILNDDKFKLFVLLSSPETL